uniref:Uncharacterized protein n=1 Tax=Scophthalmus maximus TaxID=52904 RepID=A0A8D3ALZ9_SCOMX
VRSKCVDKVLTSRSASQRHHLEDTKPCVSPGNPVFSCMMARTKHQNPLYRTTASDYGRQSPTFESSASSFYPRSQRFTKDLGRIGMYRDNTFNTALDRSRVCDYPNLQHTI